MSEQQTTFDKRHIGHAFPEFSVVVEKSRLRFFAQVTGQTDAIYLDESAATTAGYASLPVPPTFLFCLEMEGPDPDAIFRLLGVDNRHLLHAEQEFVYHAILCAGDRLTFEQRIDDIYDKKDGALQFVVRKTRVTNAQRDLVAELRNVIVMVNT